MPTYQSSTWHSKASNAVDGNADGNFLNQSCTCSAGEDKHPWWMVDLSAVLLIVHVMTFNRQDCCGMCLFVKKNTLSI